MSRENVEIVRRAIEALNARDLDRHYVEFFDPEVEWQHVGGRPRCCDPSGAARRTSATWSSGSRALMGCEADVEEYIDVGDDRVFTWCRYTGRGRASGVAGRLVPGDSSSPSETARLCAARSTYDRAEALEAAGLSE